MTARLATIERGLTGIARRVLDATPIGEAWSVHQVYSEIRRQGHSVDFRVVSGCLTSLCSQRLVREPQPGAYIRGKVATIDDEQAAQIESQAIKEAASLQPADGDPLDRLGELAGRIRLLAAEANRVADALDEATIEATGQMERLRADTKKLRQLQDLLKGMST